jgi:hypothetical protein
MVSYDTSLLRAALGLLAGTAAGASIVTLTATLAQQPLIPEVTLLVFVWATFFWGAGLILIAPLPWAVLHHYQLRNWPIAIVAGAILTPVLILGLNAKGLPLVGRAIWKNGSLTPDGLMEAAKISLLCSIAGALVAFVVWRTAYRRRTDVSD